MNSNLVEEKKERKKNQFKRWGGKVTSSKMTGQYREGRNSNIIILTNVSGPVVQVSPTLSDKMFKDPDTCFIPDTLKALGVQHAGRRGQTRRADREKAGAAPPVLGRRCRKRAAPQPEGTGPGQNRRRRCGTSQSVRTEEMARLTGLHLMGIQDTNSYLPPWNIPEN